MSKKIFETFAKMKTIQLVMLPVVIGILIILIALGIASFGSVGNQLGGVLLSFGLFVLGLMGVPLIVRKELPFLVTTIRGWIVVVEGIMLLVIWWGAAIGFLVFLFSA